MPEWCPCSARSMLVASGCGRVLVHGRALFVVFGVCVGIVFASCSSWLMHWVRISVSRTVRSFRNGAAPGSTYVQPRIG